MGSKASASVSAWNVAYKNILDLHDSAYKKIEAAITLEEQEQPHQAIERYKEGILLIDRALDVRVVCPENQDSCWDNAVHMIQKMKQTRAEALTRIYCITSSPNFLPQALPPQNITSDNTASKSNVPQTYTELADALNELPLQSISSESAEIIYACDNVSLYFISPDGTVLKTLEPQTLQIVAVPAEGNPTKTVYLQVGEWVYPLVPGVSPCYRTDYGAFILPDVYSDIAGSSIGIILPPDADVSVYELLESILLGVIGQKQKDVREPSSLSEMISNGIITGGYYISKGLIVGAQKIGSLLNYGTPKIMYALSPATEETQISPRVIRGFEIASNATKTASEITGFVAEKVGYATQALGRYLAPHIQKQGTRILTSGFQYSEEEASSKVNGVLTVAAGAVEGFATVYTGLETSASILGRNLSNNTVKVVQYKYGGPAGDVAANTFNTMGNCIVMGHHSRFFTPKGIIKNAAKQTGKAMVEDVIQSEQYQHKGAPNIYPNLQSLQNVEESGEASTSKEK